MRTMDGFILLSDGRVRLFGCIFYCCGVHAAGIEIGWGLYGSVHAVVEAGICKAFSRDFTHAVIV
ncbi:hypothetical protein PCCS19_16350 [Paenibacillus sp. CCS19]|nr:hypothetical protein PCCS19_16350 [Paenibacillus cellulosilyticus]